MILSLFLIEQLNCRLSDLVPDKTTCNGVLKYIYATKYRHIITKETNTSIMRLELFLYLLSSLWTRNLPLRRFNFSKMVRARVFVGNLVPECTNSKLTELFEKFGTVNRCDIKGTS